MGLVVVLTVGCTTPPPNHPTDASDLDETFSSPTRTRTPAPAHSRPHTRSLSHSHPRPLPLPPSPRYRGHLIDVSFDKLDLHDAFRALARIGKINIVISDKVTGTVSVNLHRVPWDQAIETLAAVKRLRLIKRDGIYLIVPHK